jgi:hypothetical protein
MTRLGACLLACALTACAQTGDFGRPARGVVNDEILPYVGRELARGRGESVSDYRMTDDERELRDRAWAVVMPPHEAQYINLVLAELRRTRILPVRRLRADKAAYVETLIGEPYRSSRARYMRLINDIDIDVSRIEPIQQVAARVARDDRARARAVERVPDVTPAERQDALARIDENGLLVAWVRESFDERLDSYRYALDRLVLETPDRMAILAEDAIARLAAVMASIRPLGPPRGVFKG